MKLKVENEAEKIEKMLRLRTFITGIQFFEEVEDMKKTEKIKLLDSRLIFCQIITMARTYGWTIGVTLDDLLPNTFCGAMLGLYDRPDFMKDGSYRAPVWFRDKQEAKKYEDNVPFITPGTYNAVAIGPIFSKRLTPEIILIYGNPAQMMMLINALQWKNYERLAFYCVGESSCADAIAQCYISRKPSLTIPCYGERRFGHAQDDELAIAMTPESLRKATEGLEKLAQNGIRYPVAYFGAQVDPKQGMPDIFKYYQSLDR